MRPFVRLFSRTIGTNGRTAISFADAFNLGKNPFVTQHGNRTKAMRYVVLLTLTVATLVAMGCNRTRYRSNADRDVYNIIGEKSNCIQKPIPPNYTVTPDQRSRFYDPTNPDCPQLPVPRPVLNGYVIPDLVTSPQPVVGTPLAASICPSQRVEELTVQPPTALANPLVVPVGFSSGAIVQVAPANEPEAVPSTRNNTTSVNKVTIPQQAWEVLPQSCLDRMFEFESLRAEYEQSFPMAKLQATVEPKQSLTLANLMELATINSRDYQSRKEVLYTAALLLTRQRYQFELNPTQFGNGTAANYRHLRAGGAEVSTLGVPTGVEVQRTLATGGQFLAQFANSVVLTFNGPSGFATDVGSELVFDFQQTLFQRDIRFENLTAAEREVIYATRDYLRFRKQLFRDVANQYYNLLLNYRSIEINAQDYFTNLRGFIQSKAEYRTAEKIPRIQVDQFEQNVLRTRSNLVTNCFTLEAALDQLKFRLGLPTEIPIYLNLAELESISLKDELSVARQMINRARAELLNARSTTAMDATTLANVSEILADRMSNILRIQQRIEAANVESQAAVEPNAQPITEAMKAVEKAKVELDELRQLLQILGLSMQVQMLKAELDEQVAAATPAPPLRVLIRAIEYCNAQLQVIDLALVSTEAGSQRQLGDQLKNRRDDVEEKLIELSAFLEKISDSLLSERGANVAEDLKNIPIRMEESVELSKQLERLVQDATKGLIPTEGKSVEAKVQATVDKTLELSDRLLEKGPDGWAEIQIDANEALLTGLVQRLDLMNQRGDLADAWRRIKLAGDDLRSIVDLRATHFLRTDSTKNDPLAFTFDDSETRLSVALDTPLNRRLQRNNFRIALINYNVGLRNLMAAEDSIKLDVREDLRQLALDRNQYTIAVASAALAYERVISTRLRLQFAVPNVAARDFLEAQQAYTAALSTIARQHVNYITDRTELFFDLEAFDVDAWGNWSGVKEDYGPAVNVDFPATNPRPYDCLPPRVRYSPTIRSMESIPPGQAIIEPQR
jgi:Outer membrane efflux protein